MWEFYEKKTSISCLPKARGYECLECTFMSQHIKRKHRENLSTVTNKIMLEAADRIENQRISDEHEVMSSTESNSTKDEETVLASRHKMKYSLSVHKKGLKHARIIRSKSILLTFQE